MSRLRAGVVRYASVADAIADAIAERLGLEPAPECRLGQARLTLTFRRLGASRWPEERQIDLALRAAAIARELLAAAPRRQVQRRAMQAEARNPTLPVADTIHVVSGPAKHSRNVAGAAHDVSVRRISSRSPWANVAPCPAPIPRA